MCPKYFSRMATGTTLWKTLGIIECAERNNLAEEKQALKELKQDSLAAVREAENFTSFHGLSIPRNVKRSGGIRKKTDEQIETSRFMSRAYTAAFGGFAVIAPMLIMSLHPTRLTQLLTASLFVVSVALILAWLMNDAERKDMIAATAAYAAVLVVFVGTTTP
jgi:hypothetical protein